jgi:hypothetical protein
MTDRRGFLGTIVAGVAGSLASPAPGAADVPRIPAIRDPNYRLLKRLQWSRSALFSSVSGARAGWRWTRR